MLLGGHPLTLFQRERQAAAAMRERRPISEADWGVAKR